MLRILTDSTSDLTAEMIAEYNIELIPLNVIIEGTTYADGVEISKEEYYRQMATAKTLPTTSQPSPALMKDRFQAVLDAGDDVFYVGLSSTLSGTMQSAKIGRDLTDCPERVHIFDSLNVSFGQGLLVLHAAKLAREGKSPEEIATELTAVRKRSRLVFSVGTLENLRKSGRINNLSFLFGSLLNIKPIMMYDTDGIVQVYDKVRGKKNAHLALHRFLSENPPDEGHILGIGHTASPELAETLQAELQELGITNTAIIEICGVVGTHVGIGTLGLLYVSK